MDRIIIVKYGEIALKGDNRSYFEKKLVSNIKVSLIGLEGYKVIRERGRIFIESKNQILDEIVERVSKVFGVIGVCVAESVENDIDKIIELAKIQVANILEDNDYNTFKVETKRTNKGFKMKSPEISKTVGGAVYENFEDLNVDVHNPDFILNIEIRELTYIYSEEIKGPGGMPYGTAGKGLLLLSGGIDSPVACWMMAKRGLEIEAVHYHSFPFTSERAYEKVIDLARILTEYTGKMVVHSVNILEIQKAINENCPSEEMTILSRRFMMGIAEKIAKMRECKALITGENIGQVASQTLEGLTVTNSRVDLPVFRPLIAYDKLDIIAIAEKIGTFETSILPFEDCCTVFLPKRVVTKPKLEKIERSEELLDVDVLIEKAINNMKTIEIKK